MNKTPRFRIDRSRRIRLASAAVAAILFFGVSRTEAADAGRGAEIFVRQCALCHTIGKGEPNRFGPNLFGIVNRKAGAAAGYVYSRAFRATANWTWSRDGIASFVLAPDKTIPGSRMGVFQGVADRDVHDLIAYLAEQK